MAQNLTRQQIQNFEAKANICQNTGQTEDCGPWQMNCISLEMFHFHGTIYKLQTRIL